LKAIQQQNREVTMAKGMSLHIGLNHVDPNHYQGWDGQLKGCVQDATDMAAIARKQKFAVSMLLNEQATADAVKVAISTVAGQLKSGDTFLLTYSGHGGQVPDTNGDEMEDKQDETWVLFDRQLVDDELFALWGRFEAGVRVLMLSDSCHSGSVAREFLRGSRAAGMPAANAPRPRAMPEEVGDRTYEANQLFYDQIQTDNPQGERVGIGASIVLISGCQDNQVSLDGAKNGVFTGALLKVWAKGRFSGGLPQFHKAIQLRIEDFQSPNYMKLGPASATFERQKPFTI
jgi:metacaspase-1